jgi:Isopentenyldiphosphate isomerase
MELWDILDESGNKTGKTIIRGELLAEKEYHLVVQVVLINRQGEFLIQKRSLRKKVRPGAWEMTSGAILSGEDSKTGVVREVREELGISLYSKELSYITRIKRKNYFLDIWVAFVDFSINDVVMQGSEVEAVKFVSKSDMLKIIFPSGICEDNYKQTMIDFLNNLDRPLLK